MQNINYHQEKGTKF